MLEPAERSLRCDGEPVEVSARYLDALVLLVRESGRLVAKDRFLDEVWRGVPVTDEALTQCIRALRRVLGDDAASPRFIETVPKHGYRFVAPVEPLSAAHAPAASRPADWRRVLLLGGSGTIGAALAGVVGGLVYGSVGASQQPDAGGASVLLVLWWLTIAAAATGGAGVSLGIAAAELAGGRAWRIAGGALGGLIVGGCVKLLGLDAFHLLLSRSPAGIAGAFEGVLLGGAVGVGAWLADRGTHGFARRVAVAAGVGGLGAVVTVLAGGRLMLGSLQRLAVTFPGSRLGIESPSHGGLDPLMLASAGLEGALFGGCITSAMLLTRRGGAERRTEAARNVRPAIG